MQKVSLPLEAEFMSSGGSSLQFTGIASAPVVLHWSSSFARTGPSVEHLDHRMAGYTWYWVEAPFARKECRELKHQVSNSGTS
jgi:hypothetical protein